MYIIISNSYASIMSNIFKGNYKNGSLIFTSMNFFLSLIVYLAVGLMLIKTYDFILKKSKTNQNIIKAELIFNNKKISTRCYLDTGNNLTYDNRPVSFINFELFHKLTNKNLMDIINNKSNDYITVNTLTGSQKLIKLELKDLNLKINNKLITSPIFALSLKLNNNYEIILNNNFV